MGWDIRQYDVLQAFLQALVDHDIFVYPSRANVEFSGQLLKLRLALYGAKQSSALFYKLLNRFLLSIGFVSSSMDPCFYKQADALIIVHEDDMRCSGTPAALPSIHEALFQRFKITCQRSRYRLPYGTSVSSLINYTTCVLSSSTRDRCSVYGTSHIHVTSVQVCHRHCSTG
jgi:hypothetical protein